MDAWKKMSEDRGITILRVEENGKSSWANWLSRRKREEKE